MHHTVVSFTLLPEAEEVLAHHDCPVLLKTIGPCLEIAFTLELDFRFGLLRTATEIVKDHF